MPLPPITLNGRPNPQAMLFAARSLVALKNRSEAESAAVAASAGARQVFWRNNPDSPAVDFSIFRDGSTMWISIFGTESVPNTISLLSGPLSLAVAAFGGDTPGQGGAQQIVGYATSRFPVYDTNVGAYVMGWAHTQAVGVIGAVNAELNQDMPQSIVVVGHSLGGATAHVLARYIGNALDPGPERGIVDRITESSVTYPLVWLIGGETLEERNLAVAEREERERRLLAQGPRVTVDLLTFGEPRSVGGGAEFSPRTHWRIVGALPGTGNVLPIDQLPVVDFVTLLPPNILVATTFRTTSLAIRIRR